MLAIVPSTVARQRRAARDHELFAAALRHCRLVKNELVPSASRTRPEERR
jgi:hypothetical protein